MQWLRNHEIAIVAGEQLPMVRKSGKTALELSGEILTKILLDTGIERGQIDGIAMTLSNSEGFNFLIVSFNTILYTSFLSIVYIDLY